jgi:hypothetical protein
VVSVEGCGVQGGACTAVPNGSGSSGGYGDNQAAPLTLFQFTRTGGYVNSLVLPQNASGANLPVSSEYGSSSESTLQLSGLGQYLAIAGYGINANTFNSSPNSYSAAPNAALAQSGSLTGQSYTPISRVVALIDANGNVNSSTALYNVFSGNNPRSVYTADGISIYISGQGTSGDDTGGVFYTTAGSNSATSITGDDATAGVSSQDTRDVRIYNNTLYVSVDSKDGSTNRDYIGTLGSTPPPTSVANGANGPAMLTGYGNSGGTGRVTITSATANGINSANDVINLSPENFFFANASTLYVADSGSPKNTSEQNVSGGSPLGDGGLQKWVNSRSDGSGTWSLKYTLAAGLGLVPNTNSAGTTGLLGLTASVTGNMVQFFATNYTIGDLDPTYLYSITDTLAATTNPGESFTLLATAPADSNFKGVSFVPGTPTGGVTITSSPSGLAFTSAGSGCAAGSYTTPQTLIWTAGTTCTLNVATPQNGAPGVQYAFSQWENGLTSTTRTVPAPTSTATYNASFTTEYELTTAAGTGGSVSPGGFIAAGTDATITATPSAGHYFVNFTGTTTSSSNPLLLAINGPQSITANFAAKITPIITWSTPAAINFGGALSSGQLDASASVPGTFVYSPPLGTVLQPGSGQTLSVTFTPSNTTIYNSAIDTTTITVNPAAASGPANLVVTTVLTRTGGDVVAHVTIANTGGTAAANVMLTSVKVGSDLATVLPQNLGTIAAGATVQATVSVPGSVGASGAASSLTVSGTYTGGTLSSSARITLP